MTGMTTHDKLKRRIQSLEKEVAEHRKATVTLQEKEKKLLTLVGAASDWINEVDLNGVYTSVNANVKDVMGYLPEEVLGRSIFDFIPDYEKKRTMKFFEDITGKQQSFSGFILTHVHKDGRHIVVETNGAPFFDASGNLIGYWGLGRDITKRVMAEEELKQSEQRWRSLVKNAPNIVLILDRKGMVKFLNRTVPGYTVEEVIGRNFLDYIEPENHAPVLETIEEVFQTGVAGSFIHIGKGPHGDTSWYETQVGPLEDKGKVIAVIMIATDITERKKAEEGLRMAHQDTERQVQERTEALSKANETLQAEIAERKRVAASLLKSEQRFRSLVEATSDLVWEIDLSGAYTYASPKAREFLGCEPEEIIGSKPFDLMPPEEAKRAASYFAEICKTQAPFSGFESTVIHRDGRVIIVETSGVPIFNSEGHFIGYRGIDRNITERVRTQEQMLQAAKMVSLGTLVSGVAHEINNPITSIMLNGPILKKIWDDISPLLDSYRKNEKDIQIGGLSYAQLSERVPLLLSDILDGTKRIKRIVDELKNFARQTPARLSDEVDINQVVKKAVRFSANLIKKTTKHFKTDYAADIPLFKGNTQYMEQVAINLIINACEALPDNNCSIQISTQYDSESGCVMIKVHDQGRGMLPEVIERIGDPFFTTKRDKGGTGLGLAISTRIIKDHGGAIVFDSAPGKGTTATVRIPANGPLGLAQK